MAVAVLFAVCVVEVVLVQGVGGAAGEGGAGREGGDDVVGIVVVIADDGAQVVVAADGEVVGHRDRGEGLVAVVGHREGVGDGLAHLGDAVTVVVPLDAVGVVAAGAIEIDSLAVASLVMSTEGSAVAVAVSLSGLEVVPSAEAEAVLVTEPALRSARVTA